MEEAGEEEGGCKRARGSSETPGSKRPRGSEGGAGGREGVEGSLEEVMARDDETLGLKERGW